MRYCPKIKHHGEVIEKKRGNLGARYGGASDTAGNINFEWFPNIGNEAAEHICPSVVEGDGSPG